jgi:phosphoribosylamine--glycine ligase
MSKFLFISTYASSLDIAFRLLQENHQVKFWVKDEDEQDTGDGFVDKVPYKTEKLPNGKEKQTAIPDAYKKFIPWADYIVIDFVGFGTLADDLRKQGKKVFGGSKYTDDLENDRLFGMTEAEKYGLLVPPHFEFTSLDDGINFVRSNTNAYALKPNGQQEKNLCFVGKEKSGEDLIGYMEGYKKNNAKKLEKAEFTLQEVVKGVEVAVSAYCDGKHLMNTKNVNFEHKKLLAGGLGVNCGETGTILMNRKGPQKLFQETLDKMENVLVKANYHGWIDINTICNEQGVWFLEFTSRWGYPQALILDECMDSDWAVDIMNVSNGTMDDWKVKEDIHAGIVVYSEGFPYWQAYEKLGIDREVEGINSETIQHIKLCEVFRKDGKILTTGSNGETVVATAIGKTAKEASDNAQEWAKKIEFPSKGWRVDIGAKTDEDILKLIKMGLLTH